MISLGKIKVQLALSRSAVVAPEKLVPQTLIETKDEIKAVLNWHKSECGMCQVMTLPRIRRIGLTG